MRAQVYMFLLVDAEKLDDKEPQKRSYAWQHKFFVEQETQSTHEGIRPG